jgi:hypothetical protein
MEVMSMKVALCISLVVLLGCGNRNQSSLATANQPELVAGNESDRIIYTDKVKGIICTNHEDWSFELPRIDLGYWTPTKGDVLEAEEEIERHLKVTPPKGWPRLGEKLAEYQRQYVGYLVKGRRMIYCNFYCEATVDSIMVDSVDGEVYETEVDKPLDCRPEVVNDGGDCFFQIDYDVDSRRVLKVAVNFDP